MVETERYSAKWISMAPGTKTRTQFYGDDRTSWVIWGGQIRFTIKGQEPFVATKGFLVQVPLRVPYSRVVVGDEPSLRFEVTRGGGILPSYPVENRATFGAPPPPKDGQHYVKVSYPTQPVGGGMDTYSGVNKPYLDFFKDVIAKYPTAGGGPAASVSSGPTMTTKPLSSAAWGYPSRPPPTRAISISRTTSSGSSWKARLPMKWRAKA